MVTEFCSTCGILLPLDLVGQSFCQPCRRERDEGRHGKTDRVCQCEYCGKNQSSKYPNTSPPFSPREHEIVEKKSHTSYNKSENKHQRKKSAERVKQKGKQKVARFDKRDEASNELNARNQSSSDSNCVSLFETSEPQFASDDWDWSQEIIQPSMDWADPDWNPPPADNEDSFVDARDDQATDWTMVGKKSPRNKLFGGHDFPILGTCEKESDILHLVRDEWEREQAEYKQRLEIKDTPDISRLTVGHRRKSQKRRFHIGGVDISFIKDNSTDACACLSVVRLPDLELVYQRMEMVQLTQPYIPGFLAFREVPALADLFAKLKAEAPQYTPDVIMVDGNGILHPRGFGLASHLGVTLDVPTIGVAKTLMSAQGIVDDNAHKLKKQTLLSGAGDGFDLIADSGQALGRCVRVHENAPNPVYVSVGHRITLNSAVWLVLECSKYRIPEPIRRADLDSREYIRQGLKDPSVFIK